MFVANFHQALNYASLFKESKTVPIENCKETAKKIVKKTVKKTLNKNAKKTAKKTTKKTYLQFSIQFYLQFSTEFYLQTGPKTHREPWRAIGVGGVEEAVLEVGDAQLGGGEEGEEGEGTDCNNNNKFIKTEV